ncbi:MAG: hypothetical protein IKB98_08695 [Clostridia bacterium]|nr:hypothetical protein [Clostridia bacterium]
MSNDLVKQPKKNIVTKIKENKKIQYFLIAICFVIVAVILFGSFFSKTSNSKVNSIDSYVENLEKRLCETLSKVEGAGDVSVVITIESGMETVLATKKVVSETPTGVQTEETPLIVNGKTVVVKELYPKIIGVLIVAEGAKNIAVMSKIQQATISLLDININQIEILSMS